MKENSQNSPQLGHSIDNGDANYVSGLSTLLVATIQETKDRISQIEYLFCSQLFPNIQLHSESLQKIYCEARKAAEDEWKRKENELGLQLEKLQLEKLQALDENNALQVEKEKLSKDREEDTNLLLAKLGSLEKTVKDLERKLLKKSEEVDEGMVMQKRLIQLVQTKSTELVNEGKELKEHEENINMLVVKSKCLEKKVDELCKELSNKTEEVIKGKELQENLLKKIESQDLKMDSEFRLNDHEKDKRLLTAMVDDLQRELKKKTEEVDEGRKLLENLLQDTDLNGPTVLKNERHLEEHEKEEKLCLARQKGSMEKVDEHQVNLLWRSTDVAKRKEAYNSLFQQVESKDQELQSERKRMKDIIAAYKRLKSQYTFLCKKMGLTVENMRPPNEVEAEKGSLKHYQNPTTLPGRELKILDTSGVLSETNKLNNGTLIKENLEDVKGSRSIKTSNSLLPSTSISPFAPEHPANKQSTPLAGNKRSASSWRDTRARQCEGGPDPHDDFLDTPFENIRGNKNKVTKEEVHYSVGVVPNGAKIDSSDEETQDMNVNEPQKLQITISRPGTKDFKYVELVRKKAERENLKGIECKQCKKFYDAVLPDGSKGADGNKRNARCEHHEGVSRHRYRYVPPSTPEGFWNIGFDSDM